MSLKTAHQTCRTSRLGRADSRKAESKSWISCSVVPERTTLGMNAALMMNGECATSATSGPTPGRLTLLHQSSEAVLAVINRNDDGIVELRGYL